MRIRKLCDMIFSLFPSAYYISCYYLCGGNSMSVQPTRRGCCTHPFYALHIPKYIPVNCWSDYLKACSHERLVVRLIDETTSPNQLDAPDSSRFQELIIINRWCERAFKVQLIQTRLAAYLKRCKYCLRGQYDVLLLYMWKGAASREEGCSILWGRV